MPQVSAFLQQIKSSFINAIILSDYRGISPGGTITLDLSRGHTPFATLVIRSLHPTTDQFANTDSYVITEVTIDNAEVIRLRKPTSAVNLWERVESLIQGR